MINSKALAILNTSKCSSSHSAVVLPDLKIQRFVQTVAVISGPNQEVPFTLGVWKCVDCASAPSAGSKRLKLGCWREAVPCSRYT